MYEITDKGVDDGHKFVTCTDKNTGLEMTYFEQEIQHIKEDELREFLEEHLN